MSSFQRCSPRNLRDYQIFSKLMIFFVRVATRVQKAPITVPKENYEITRPPFDAPGHTEFRSSPLDASIPRQNLISRIRNKGDRPRARRRCYPTTTTTTTTSVTTTTVTTVTTRTDDCSNPEPPFPFFPRARSPGPLRYLSDFRRNRNFHLSSPHPPPSPTQLLFNPHSPAPL